MNSLDFFTWCLQAAGGILVIAIAIFTAKTLLLGRFN